jgi:hypothetical protein
MALGVHEVREFMHKIAFRRSSGIIGLMLGKQTAIAIESE